VTGAIGKRAHAPAAPAPQERAEPVASAEPRQEAPRPAVRPTAADEMGGLEIPAFLRRQQS
jgi:hypothetical protein